MRRSYQGVSEAPVEGAHCFKQASASTVLLKAGQVFQVALVVYTNTKERHVRTTYNADHRRPPPVEKILVTLTKQTNQSAIYCRIK